MGYRRPGSANEPVAKLLRLEAVNLAIRVGLPLLRLPKLGYLRVLVPYHLRDVLRLCPLKPLCVKCRLYLLVPLLSVRSIVLLAGLWRREGICRLGGESCVYVRHLRRVGAW
jgi:hypothetical protein